MRVLSMGQRRPKGRAQRPKRVCHGSTAAGDPGDREVESAAGKGTVVQGDGASSEERSHQRPDDSWHCDCSRDPKWLGIICILLFSISPAAQANIKAISRSFS